jgi:hypothetical protein
MVMEHSGLSGMIRMYCTFPFIDMMEATSTPRVTLEQWIWSEVVQARERE